MAGLRGLAWAMCLGRRPPREGSEGLAGAHDRALVMRPVGVSRRGQGVVSLRCLLSQRGGRVGGALASVSEIGWLSQRLGLLDFSGGSVSGIGPYLRCWASGFSRRPSLWGRSPFRGFLAPFGLEAPPGLKAWGALAKLGLLGLILA